jgi:hypothetical protein
MHMQRMTERNKQRERLRPRYAGRGKAGKSRLLDELCEPMVISILSQRTG